jgi:hypothetical protein
MDGSARSVLIAAAAVAASLGLLQSGTEVWTNIASITSVIVVTGCATTDAIAAADACNPRKSPEIRMCI